MTNEKDCLLRRIQAEDFVLYDTALFLDGHPRHRKALMYYHKHLEIAKKLREEYACLKRGMDKYSWKWRPLSFTGERVLGYPDRLDPQTAALLRRWDAARIRMADALLRQTGASYAYRVPWPAPGEPWVGAMSFGASHPLVRAMHFAAAFRARESYRVDIRAVKFDVVGTVRRQRFKFVD